MPSEQAELLSNYKFTENLLWMIETAEVRTENYTFKRHLKQKTREREIARVWKSENYNSI